MKEMEIPKSTAYTTVPFLCKAKINGSHATVFAISICLDDPTESSDGTGFLHYVDNKGRIDMTAVSLSQPDPDVGNYELFPHLKTILSQ